MHYMLSPEGRKRYFDELLPLLHRTKLEVMGPRDADCYYLVYLGTKPKSRGRGYARALIEDMIRVVSLPFSHSSVTLLSSPEIKVARAPLGSKERRIRIKAWTNTAPGGSLANLLMRKTV